MLLVTLAVVEAPAAVASTPLRPWRAHVREAEAYAATRAGTVSFGVRTRHGLRGVGVERTMPSASVVKAMLLVAYLRQAGVRGRRLRPDGRALLGPMIRRSDNAAASRVCNVVGTGGLARLARRSHMRRFHATRPWGLSTIDVTNELAAARREFRRFVLEALREQCATDEEFDAESRGLTG